MKFGPDEIEQIDRTSLRILSELGVRLDDEALRDAALKAGARPGRSGDIILLPPQMVEELRKRAPRRINISDCSGKLTALEPGGRPTFWTGAALNIIEGHESRPIGRQDLANLSRVAEAMPDVAAMVGTSVAEVPPAARDVVGLGIMARNTRKHLRPLLFTAAGLEPMMEIARVLADGAPLAERPLISFGYSCLSPLHWSQVSCELWRRTSGHGLPLMLNGEPVTGGTAPVTLAGSIALGNAEILAGICLVQLLEPGRPVVHNLGFAHTMDMRTAACLSGSAECALMAWAGARMAAHYGLPSASWMGADAFIDDEQAAMEKTLTGLTHVAGGVNVIWGVGQLQSQKALSAAQMVLDQEIAQTLQRLRQGFEVNEDTLAYDVIAESVLGGEEFISHEHTLLNFRKVLMESRLLARTQRENWEIGGSRRLSQVAEDRVAEILSQPAPQLLRDDQIREIERIERRAVEAAS